MKVSEIKIKRNFKQTAPSEDKLQACRTFFNENGKLDRDIVVDKHSRLCDGYVGYLVLVENGIDDIDVIYDQAHKSKNNIYVFARHGDNNKEYVWKAPKKINAKDIKVGSGILVQTRFGIKTVIVTRVETLSVPPVSTPIKKVVRCLTT